MLIRALLAHNVGARGMCSLDVLKTFHVFQRILLLGVHYFVPSKTTAVWCVHACTRRFVRVDKTQTKALCNGSSTCARCYGGEIACGARILSGAER